MLFIVTKRGFIWDVREMTVWSSDEISQNMAFFNRNYPTLAQFYHLHQAELQNFETENDCIAMMQAEYSEIMAAI